MEMHRRKKRKPTARNRKFGKCARDCHPSQSAKAYGKCVRDCMKRR